MTLTKIALGIAVAALLAPGTAEGASTAVSAPVPPVARTPQGCTSATCYVDVSVAQVWVSPEAVLARARPDGGPVDAKALGNPVDIRGWLGDLGRAGELRRSVPGETQALYGTKVTVVERRTVGGTLWDKVEVQGQPTEKNARGYPGWVADRQLTAVRRELPDATPERIAVPTAWSHSTPGAAALRSPQGRLTEYSYGTAFSVGTVEDAAGVLSARINDGSTVYFNAGDLDPVPKGGTGADAVREARRFLGLDYLWSGASGFGYDCSGLTNQVYAMLGVTIPRDSQPQFDAGAGRAPAGSARGRRIDKEADLRPGDVVAFGTAPATATHVGLYVGRDERGGPMMIDAPRTGDRVREEPMRGRVFLGATRFLPAP